MPAAPNFIQQETWLGKLLACPACHGELAWSGDQITCVSCGRGFPVVDGIPILLLDPSEAEHDELLHHHGSHAGHAKRDGQAEYYDTRVDAEFETSRPHGTPALYRWCLAQKFEHSLLGLDRASLSDLALTVCGGSGMDAEFLAGVGARVICSDLSLGAARRTRERALRYGLQVVAVVADACQLPFRDRSINLVYVHDGLHHLEQPYEAIAEMARIAAHSISITEPARATATALAVRLGWALEVEDAGNRVARLDPAEVGAALQRRGFRVVHADRYVLYYKHEPGWVMRLLSLPPLLPLVTFGWRAINRVLGRFGNKLTVAATRRSPEAADPSAGP